jgi:hypothetical protein
MFPILFTPSHQVPRTGELSVADLCVGEHIASGIRRATAVYGKVVQIIYSAVKGRQPLNTTELRNFQTVAARYAEEIVQKWIDYFVLHKPVEAQKITQRIK